jgi:hypothetical protein
LGASGVIIENNVTKREESMFCQVKSDEFILEVAD